MFTAGKLLKSRVSAVALIGVTVVTGVSSLIGLSGVAAGAATPHALATAGLGYTPLSSPVRIADSRSGATDPATYAGKTLAEGASLTVDVPTADIPSNASAVVVNVTAITPAAAGYLSVYPGGSTNPGTANVTFTANQTVGNLVTVGLGPDSSTSSTQSFTVYNGPSTNGGSVDFTADLEGYYAPATATAGGLYNALAPARVYDSRTGSGEPGAGTTLTGGGHDNVTVTGVGGVPATATAVVLNVAVTNTTASSYISAYPTGSPPAVPTASQNFLAGETLSAQVISGVGTGGMVTIANNAGNADIVVDVDGFFTPAGGTGSLLTVLSSPVRLLDTRPTGVAAGSSATTTVQGTGATAGVLSIADIATGGNYLTEYATGSTAPLAANVNYTSGDTYNIVENSAYATTATGGGISILNGPANGSPANVVVDEFGFFAPAAATATAYTVTPSTPQNVPPSETATPTAGAITYTATGMGTTPVDIELFAGANVTAASGGGFTFTNNGTVATQGTVGATITAINGAAVTPGTQFNAVPSVAGSITFTINSSSIESDWPVVFADDAAHTLPVNSGGGPTAAYGVGGEATWTPPAAPAGEYDDVYVQTVNAAANTFVACLFPVTDSAGCYTFNLTPPAGVTNFYGYDATSDFDITQAGFLSYLSGATPPFTSPTSAARQVDGDVVYADVASGSAASDFYIEADVPNAPTAVVGSVPSTSPFETVGFTAPINAAPPANAVEGYLIYAAPEVGSGSTATYTFPTSVPNGDPTLNGDYEINDAAGTNPFSTFGVCTPVTSVCENATAGLPTGTYEFEVQAYNDDGFNSPMSAPSAALAVTATPIAPVSTESVLTQGTNAGNNLRALDIGDTLQFIYANTSATNPLTVATNASVTLVDSYGAEVSLTNGSNATFTVSGGGTTLTIAVTGAPALVSPATPGNASPNPTELTTYHNFPGTRNVDAVLSDTGISTTNGAWNLAVSGLHSPPAPYSTVTRIFDSGDTAGAATTVTNNNGLPGAFTTSLVTVTTPNTVVLAGGDPNAATGDPVTVYSAQGTVLGTGTYTNAPTTTTITTTSSFLPGAVLYVVYQDTSGHAGVFTGGPSNQPSASDSVTVPGLPDVTDVTGAGKTLSVTWGTSVTELLAASNYTVSDDDCDSAVATGTNVTPSPGTTVTLTLNTALTNDSSYELCVNPATVEDSSSQVNVTQDVSFDTNPDTITVVTGPDVSSSVTTTNTDPTWTGTATTAGTAVESTVEADFNSEGFSTAGVSITSGSGTGNVAWTFTPTTGEGAPLNNGAYSVVFEVNANDGSSANTGVIGFNETGGVAATDTITVTTGPNVNSSATTSNTQPAFGGTATTGSANTISEAATYGIYADLNGAGFNQAGVSITSGSGTDSVSWTYTPPSPLSNGPNNVQFLVKDSSGGNQTSTDVSFSENGSTLLISSATVTPGSGIQLTFNNPVSCANSPGDWAAWVFTDSYNGPGAASTLTFSSEVENEGGFGCLLFDTHLGSNDAGTLTYTQPPLSSDRIGGDPGPDLASVANVPVLDVTPPKMTAVNANHLNSPASISVSYNSPVSCTSAAANNGGDYTVTLNGTPVVVDSAACVSPTNGSSAIVLVTIDAATIAGQTVSVTTAGNVKDINGNAETTSTVSSTVG